MGTRTGESVPGREPKTNLIVDGSQLRTNPTTRTAGAWIKAITVYAVGLGTLATTLTLVQDQVSKLFPSCPTWLWLLAGSVPLCVGFVTHTVPAIVAKRRERNLSQWVIQGSATQSYFRLGPYESTAEDQKRYVRADGAQEVVLRWISTGTERILFLTGSSGAGKSSLLNAYVLPHLSEGEDRYVTITLRAGLRDPLDAVRAEIIKPGLIWERPPAMLSSGGLVSVLEKVSERLGSRQALIVFDQFEELLLIHEDQDDRTRSFRDFLTTIKNDGPANVRLLFVMRSDYIGLAQASPWSELLPPMREGTNWRDVTSFRERDARNFLESSGLKIGPRFVDQLFDQIAEFEGTAGLVRPITVNMLGMALDTAALPTARILRESGRVSGGLLVEFVRQRIYKTEIAQHAPIILAQMMEKGGFRKPRCIRQLAESTGFRPSVISGVLLQLLQSGMVRIIDAQQQIWEISHDFVARILDHVLRESRTNLWRRGQQVALPVSVALWVGLFVAMPRIVKSLETVRTADITAELTVDSGEPGQTCPPGLDTTTLTLIGSTHYAKDSKREYWYSDALGPEAELRLIAKGSSPISDPSGEAGHEEQCNNTINFTQFSGNLGTLEHPGQWKNAWLEATIKARADDQAWVSFYKTSVDESNTESIQKEFREFYRIPEKDNTFGTSTGLMETLSIFVNGKPVASAWGIVVVTGGGVHDDPSTYILKFTPFRSDGIDSD